MRHLQSRIYSKININNYCKVKLTPYGVYILIEYHKKYKLLGNVEIKDMYRFDDGWYQFQLSDFMYIFGKYMSMGAVSVTENNLMKIYHD